MSRSLLPVCHVLLKRRLSLRFHVAQALYIYEYLIVIDQEIALVWKAKWKLSTLLFLVNRYVALMVALVYTVPVVDYTTQAVSIFIR